MEVTTQTGHYYRVERRYSAFHSLNKQAKKLGLGPTADFPPKRIRNTSAKVLESRRKGLEHWVQSLARRGPVPQLLLSFLERAMDTNWEVAMFQELGSAPPAMEAGKVCDANGLFEGHATEAADAKQAYVQAP